MLGSGLHFNSPGVVRVQKTFSAATVPGFSWPDIKSSFVSQNIICTLPLKGPSLIPFMCSTNALNVNNDAATELYILYYGNSTVAAVPLFTLGLSGAWTANSFNGLNSSGLANEYWLSNNTTNAGICIAANSPFASGDSLTITLWCVQSGLNY